MRSRKLPERIAGFFKLIYVKLVKIDAKPHDIAIGFAIGVFAGIMPFAGPFAALALAIFFKVNRASAVLGSLLTNTWISLIAFFLSVKIGSLILGADAGLVSARWTALLKDFHPAAFFKLSALEIVLPVVAGYLVIAALSGFAAYFIVRVIMKFAKKKD